MRSLLKVVMLSVIILGCCAGSRPPVVSYNVLVAQGVNQSQCADWRGQAGPEDDMETYSRFGINTDISGPGTRTCTGCNIQGQNDCVCDTCYDYFD